jgi:hypothetical protein
MEISEPNPGTASCGVSLIIGTHDEDDHQFYVKFSHSSYRHCRWVTEEFLSSLSNYTGIMLTFRIQSTYGLSPVPEIPHLLKPIPIPWSPEFLVPDEVISESSGHYLIRWKGLPFAESTWETEGPPELVAISRASCPKPIVLRDIPSSFSLQRPPVSVFQDGNVLIPDEQQCCDGLVKSFCIGKQSSLVTLAKFGKARIIAAYFVNVGEICNRRGPFLVIVSHSSLSNWCSLLNEWTDFRLLNLSGTLRDREVARQYCLFSDSSQQFIKAEVIVTSFPTLINDVQHFRSIEWLSVVIDDQTSPVKLDIVRPAESLYARHRVTIVSEDPSLAMPDYAGNIVRFDEVKKESFEDSHEIRKFVDLTAFQLSLYRSVLFSNRFFMGKSHANRVVLQKLLDICHHPFLDDSLDDNTPGLELSSKLALLHELLSELKRNMCRVLLVAGDQRMVNLLERYLGSVRYHYERLDGSSDCRIVRRTNDRTFVYLSVFRDNLLSIVDADTVIDYTCCAWSCFPRRLIHYRLFTCGTLELDVLDHRFVRDDEFMERVLRSTAYHVFFGGEANDVGLLSRNFWSDVFVASENHLPGLLVLDAQIYREAIESIRQFGCYQTIERLISKYTCVKLLCGAIIATCRSFRQQKCDALSELYWKQISHATNYSSSEVLPQLLIANPDEVLAHATTIDLSWRAASWLSNEGKDHPFVFGQSMPVPNYWNEMFDYCLLYLLDGDRSALQSELTRLGFLFAELPNEGWLRTRRNLLIFELCLIIPESYVPINAPQTPGTDWGQDAPSPKALLESRVMIHRMMRFLYLFGLPANFDKNPLGSWNRVRSMLHLPRFPIEVIQSIVHAIVERCDDVSPLMPQSVNVAPMRVVRTAWIPKPAIDAIASNLRLFFALRSRRIDSKFIEAIARAGRWSAAGKFNWTHSHDAWLLRSAFVRGFMLAGVQELVAIEALSPSEKMMVEKAKKDELLLLEPMLPKCFSQFTFLKNIDATANRLVVLMSFVFNEA